MGGKLMGALPWTASNSYDWQGTLCDDDMREFYFRLWQKKGMINGNNTVVRVPIMDFVRPGQIREHRPKWLRRSPKSLTTMLYHKGLYQADIGDYWLDPQAFINGDLTGDCEDAAIALLSALIAKGLDARLLLCEKYDPKVGPDDPPAKINHAAVLLFKDGQVRVLDATTPRGRLRRNSGVYKRGEMVRNIVPILSFAKDDRIWEHGEV